jgi:3-deoxy-D-manno-octulosonate 8-phosphate phosphatase (KDO 8-P phosphatase)
MPVKEILTHYTKDQIKKAAQVKAIFVDVDGVLTNGKIIYDDAGREIKSFHVRDGHIISYLKKAGILIGIITGRDSPVVAKRAAELKLDFCHQGIVDKGATCEKLISFYKLKKKQIAYIGDDLIDLSGMRLSGFTASPIDAPEYIRNRVDLVTRVKGGQGVLREVADLILAANGTFDKILKEA